MPSIAMGQSMDEWPQKLEWVMTLISTTIFKTSCCILLLCVAAAAAENQAADSALGRRVDEMFQMGYARGPRAFQDSQKLCDSLRVASKNDPRIDYAHGLVLLKLLRYKEAKTEFQVATKRPGNLYSPAWQALIWSNFIAKEFDDGYDRLIDFAKLVTASESLTDDMRREEAYWIGRVMASLEMSLDSNQARESWLQTDEKLTKYLGKGLMDGYLGGKEEVHARHMVLEDDIRQTRLREKDRQAELQEKKIDQAGKSAGAAKEKGENLKKSAAEMKEEFEEQAAVFKRQMERLEKDYAMLERRGLTLLTQMLTFDQQINLLQNNRSSNSGSAQNLAALQNRRVLMENEFQLTAAASQQVSANARQLAEARADYIEQYQRVTGEIVKEEANAEKWKARAEKQAKELKESAKKPKGAPPALAAKIQAVTAFRTYCDLDLAVEREKVVASFGVAQAGK